MFASLGRSILAALQFVLAGLATSTPYRLCVGVGRELGVRCEFFRYVDRLEIGGGVSLRGLDAGVKISGEGEVQLGEDGGRTE